MENNTPKSERIYFCLNVLFRSAKKVRQYSQVLLSFSIHSHSGPGANVTRTTTGVEVVAATVLSHNGVYARFAADRIDQTDHLHSQKLDDFRFPVAVLVGRVIRVAVFRFEREFIQSTDERMRNEKIFIL